MDLIAFAQDSLQLGPRSADANIWVGWSEPGVEVSVPHLGQNWNPSAIGVLQFTHFM